VIAVWLLRVNPRATGDEVLYNSDAHVYFYPMLAVLYGTLGWDAVLWNPFQGFGIPTLGTLQAGYLYPPHILYRFVPTGAAMQFLTILHLGLGGWFAVLWSRSAGTEWAPALVAGVAFSLSYLFGAMYSSCWLETIAWVPLCMDSIERYVRRGEFRGLPLLALSIAMLFLAGGYQGSVYGLLGAGIYAAFALLHPVAWRDTLRVALGLLVAAGLGLALAAPQLLPTYELAQLTERSTQGLSMARRLPFGVMDTSFLGMVEGLVRPPDRIVPGYIGAVPLALAVVGLLSRRHRVLASACALAAWAGLNLMLPRWFLDVLEHIPVMSWFRFPQRSVLLLHAAVAILAALGTEILLFTSLADRRRAAGAGGTLLLACAAFAWLRFPGELWWVPVTLAAAVALGRALARPALLGAVLVLLTVYDLTGTTRNDLLMPWMDQARTELGARTAVVRAVAERAGLDRVFLVGAQFNSRLWFPKLAALGGASTPFDYEPLSPVALGDYISFAARGHTLAPDRTIPFTGSPTPEEEPPLLTQGRRYMAAMSVRYYLLPEHADAGFVQQLIASGLTVVEDEQASWPRLTLLQDATALPRAYAVYGVACASDASDALAQIPSLDLRSYALLEGPCTPQPPPEGAAIPDARIERYAPTRVEIRATLAIPGHLVLTDAFHPDWRVSVDGEPAAIRRTNALARAVALPAGEHLVVFSYDPASFRVGLLVAGLTLALLILVSLRSVRSRLSPLVTTRV
jgi:hypothetical protein